MSLDKIYEPIQQDLDKVEERLNAISKAELCWLPEPLASDLIESGQLANLLDHSLKSKGKRIRPALVLLAGKFYRYDPEFLLPMATAIEVLHTATLIHDDAIDNSPVRRGRPTINEIWGDEKAILLGDYLVAKAGELTVATRNPQASKLLHQTLMTITSGELAQSFDAFNPEQTLQHYIHRITSKTAALFSLATEVGAILSHAPTKSVKVLKEYGHNLGIAFQIIDDIMDYVGTKAEIGKPIGSDLTQGTFTLPAILLLEHYPENNSVRDLLQEVHKAEIVERVIELVRGSSIAQECYALASEYSNRACRSLIFLPENRSRQSLTDLAHYVVVRKR